MIRLAFLLFLSLFTFEARSQTLPDSIRAEMEKLLTTSEKAAYLLSLSKSALQSDTDLNEALLQEAWKLAKVLDHLELKAEVFTKLGVQRTYQNKFEEADSLLKKGLSFYQQLSDSAGMGGVHTDLGVLSYYQMDDFGAIEQWIKAYHYFGTETNLMARARLANNISSGYRNVGELENALKYALLSLELKKQVNDPRIYSTYHNIGNILYELGKPDSALYYLQVSGELKKAKNDLRGLSIFYNSMADVHAQLKSPDSTFFYYQKAIDLDVQLQDSVALAQDIFALGEAYTQFGRWQKAKQELNKALAISKNPETIEKSYKLLSEVYQQQQQYKLANEMLLRYVQVHDSIRTTEKDKAIAELQTSFETAQKEQQISSLEKENQVQQLKVERAENQRLFFILLAGISVILALVLFNRFRLKQQAAQIAEERNEALSELNTTKDRLFALIAHDLKNPLSAFNTLTSTLHEYYDSFSPDDMKAYLQKLNQASANLEDQLKNLLEWAIIQMSERRVDKQPVNLYQLAEEVKSFYQLNIDSKKIRLENLIPDHLQIESDKEYLKTILRNLVSNAIKFTPVGGEVRLNAHQNGKLALSVEDTGLGISAEDLPKLFDSKADKKGIGKSKEKGTGLGLSLVKEMVEKLNGEVKAESKLGEGTKMLVLLS